MNNPSQKCECKCHCSFGPCEAWQHSPRFSLFTCEHCRLIGEQKSESPATPKLNVKGQCPYCSKKPLMYKRDGGYYFCTRCNRQWDLAGNFQENFMWNRNNKCKHPGRPKNSSCPDCGEWDTESRQNNDNLGKAMQPVGGVSVDKPSTGEDWEVIFHKTFCDSRPKRKGHRCVANSGYEVAYDLEGIKSFINALLQQKRERAEKIVQFHDFRLGCKKCEQWTNPVIEEIKQQILKDNQ